MCAVRNVITILAWTPALSTAAPKLMLAESTDCGGFVNVVIGVVCTYELVV